jgi:hypothetical protein
MDLFIKDEAGEEHALKIRGDIPLREGHHVMFVRARLRGDRNALNCLVINKTLQKAHFVESSRRTLQPGPGEILATVGAVALIVLICFLIGMAKMEAGFVVAIFLLGAIALFGLARYGHLRRRFDEHCRRIGEALL